MLSDEAPPVPNYLSENGNVTAGCGHCNWLHADCGVINLNEAAVTAIGMKHAENGPQNSSPNLELLSQTPAPTHFRQTSDYPFLASKSKLPGNHQNSNLSWPASNSLAGASSANSHEAFKLRIDVPLFLVRSCILSFHFLC